MVYPRGEEILRLNLVYIASLFTFAFKWELDLGYPPLELPPEW